MRPSLKAFSFWPGCLGLQRPQVEHLAGWLIRDQMVLLTSSADHWAVFLHLLWLLKWLYVSSNSWGTEEKEKVYTFWKGLSIQFAKNCQKTPLFTNFFIVFCLFAKKNLAPYQLVLVKQMAPFTTQLSVFVYLHELSSTALEGKIQPRSHMFCFPLCVSFDLSNWLPVNPQALDYL